MPKKEPGDKHRVTILCPDRGLLKDSTLLYNQLLKKYFQDSIPEGRMVLELEPKHGAASALRRAGMVARRSPVVKPRRKR